MPDPKVINQLAVFAQSCQDLYSSLCTLALGAAMAVVEVTTQPRPAATRLRNVADEMRRVATHVEQLSLDIASWWEKAAEKAKRQAALAKLKEETNERQTDKQQAP